MNLTTVTFKGVDGNRASVDLPTDGVADASTVRSLNTAARSRMITADAIDDMRAVADACSHAALEHGRNAMSNVRGTLATMSAVDRANTLKGLLKLRATRRF